MAKTPCSHGRELLYNYKETCVCVVEAPRSVAKGTPAIV
jgi:hypothetical protein